MRYDCQCLFIGNEYFIAPVGRCSPSSAFVCWVQFFWNCSFHKKPAASTSSSLLWVNGICIAKRRSDGREGDKERGRVDQGKVEAIAAVQLVLHISPCTGRQGKVLCLPVEEDYRKMSNQCHHVGTTHAKYIENTTLKTQTEREKMIIYLTQCTHCQK